MSPTAARAAIPPLGRLESVDRRGFANDPSRACTVVTVPFAADTARTVPSSATVPAASPPTVASFLASPETPLSEPWPVAGSTCVAHNAPDSGSTTLTTEPPIAGRPLIETCWSGTVAPCVTSIGVRMPAGS